jgi:hypothetical protein
VFHMRKKANKEAELLGSPPHFSEYLREASMLCQNIKSLPPLCILVVRFAGEWPLDIIYEL